MQTKLNGKDLLEILKRLRQYKQLVFQINQGNYTSLIVFIDSFLNQSSEGYKQIQQQLFEQDILKLHSESHSGQLLQQKKQKQQNQVLKVSLRDSHDVIESRGSQQESKRGLQQLQSQQKDDKFKSDLNNLQKEKAKESLRGVQIERKIVRFINEYLKKQSESTLSLKFAENLANSRFREMQDSIQRKIMQNFDLFDEEFEDQLKEKNSKTDLSVDQTNSQEMVTSNENQGMLASKVSKPSVRIIDENKGISLDLLNTNTMEQMNGSRNYFAEDITPGNQQNLMQQQQAANYQQLQQKQMRQLDSLLIDEKNYTKYQSNMTSQQNSQNSKNDIFLNDFNKYMQNKLPDPLISKRELSNKYVHQEEIQKYYKKAEKREEDLERQKIIALGTHKRNTVLTPNQKDRSYDAQKERLISLNQEKELELLEQKLQRRQVHQKNLVKKLKLQNNGKEGKFLETINSFKGLPGFVDIKPFLRDLNVLNHKKSQETLQKIKKNVDKQKQKQELNEILEVEIPLGQQEEAINKTKGKLDKSHKEIQNLRNKVQGVEGRQMINQLQKEFLLNYLLEKQEQGDRKNDEDNFYEILNQELFENVMGNKLELGEQENEEVLQLLMQNIQGGDIEIFTEQDYLRFRRKLQERLLTLDQLEQNVEVSSQKFHQNFKQKADRLLKELSRKQDEYFNQKWKHIDKFFEEKKILQNQFTKNKLKSLEEQFKQKTTLYNAPGQKEMTLEEQQKRDQERASVKNMGQTQFDQKIKTKSSQFLSPDNRLSVMEFNYNKNNLTPMQLPSVNFISNNNLLFNNNERKSFYQTKLLNGNPSLNQLSNQQIPQKQIIKVKFDKFLNTIDKFYERQQDSNELQTYQKFNRFEQEDRKKYKPIDIETIRDLSELTNEYLMGKNNKNAIRRTLDKDRIK